jgi:hypothetical protein
MAMRHDDRHDEAARRSDGCDLDDLLHPAQAFGHPREVVADPDLTLNEKRAILASWASDACAIEAAPDLRRSHAGPPVRFDDIMEALRTLDRQAAASSERERRKARRRAIFGHGRSGGQDDRGAPLM